MAATQTAIQTPPLPTAISLDEYLHTRYRPDVHFVDGHIEHRRPPEGTYTQSEIEELFVGEWEHNRLQTLMAQWFANHEAEWPIDTVTEQRMRVSPSRIRVCDVCILRADAPRERMTLTPPFLCIEIMSPTDRLSRAKIVLEDYRLMGVPNIWLVNPFRRMAWRYDSTGLNEVSIERLDIPDSPVHLMLAEFIAKVGL